jgi:chromosome partitioning protein
MGFIILVGGEKGGPGKSTLAQNLAVFFAKELEQDTLLLDADVQGTSADWFDERMRNDEHNLVRINCVQKTENLRDVLEDLSTRYQVIVIDTGGFDSEALRSGMVVSDVCLFPLRPKRRDLRTLDKIDQISRLAKAHNKEGKFFVVICQCPSSPNQRYRVDYAMGACGSYGLDVFRSVTQSRNSYDDCDEGGLTVLEYSDKKAREEVLAIGHELVDRCEYVKE